MSFPNEETNQSITASMCPDILAQIEERMDEFRDNNAFRIAVICCYAVIVGAGAFGNCLVFGIIAKDSEMRTMRNNLIVLLAFSDFVMCTTTAPITLWMSLRANFPAGDTACRVLSSVQVANVFVSTMCITAISLDRYFLILFPTNQRAKQLIPMASMILIWIIALVMTVPILVASGVRLVAPHNSFSLELKNVCGIEVHMCTEDKYEWWTRLGKKTYTSFCVLFQYVLPLCGIIFMNTKIKGRLEEQDEKFHSADKIPLNRANARRTSSKRSQKIGYLIIAVVVTFALTWLPLNIYNLVNSFADQHNTNIFVICHLVAMLSACLNPVLYGVFNGNFRRAFMNALGCKSAGTA